MMNNLIKREDAIEAVESTTWYHQNRNKDMVEGANSDEHQAWYKSQDIYEALEAVPSADRPSDPHDITYINALKNRIRELEDNRPQGEYVKGENGEWYCSNCKRIDDKYSVARFCWWCGARMKGADNE